MARWADRALAAIGLRRRKAGHRTAFAGAAFSRLTEDWVFSPIQSADQEVRGDLRTLRARSREMVRNHSYAARFVDLVAENVIGPHGIRLQARVTRANGDFDSGINETVEAAWKEWGLPETASVDGRLSWVDVQTLAVQGVAQDGEALIRMVPAFDNPFGFSLQLLDPDQLDPEFNRVAGNGTNEIRMGVEIDGWGRPVAYWLWDGHPAEYQQRERKRIPASQIVHLYLQRRVGQTRGVPWLAPVLADAKMLRGYQEAELVAARMGAAKSVFFEQDPEAVGDPNAPDADAAVPLEADPGNYSLLPPGVKPHFYDPHHPNAGFQGFSQSILRSIASGLHVSYNLLANDLVGVNYSSIRAGLLSERDVWKRLQQWVSVHLHRRVYREWMRWAITSGALELPSRNTGRWGAHLWLPRGWTWVDPLKDIQAAAFAVGMRVDSLRRVASEQGRDFEEIVADIAQERAIMKAYGIPLTENHTPQKFGEQGDDDDEDEDEAGSATGDAEDDGDRGGRAPLLRLARRFG